MTGRRMGLTIENLSVRDAAGRALVSSFSLVLPASSIHIILGESGAGKSIVCAAVAGTLSQDLHCSGRIILDHVELSALLPRERRATWSRDVFLLPQEPWNALAPSRSLIGQVADMPRTHRHESRRQAFASSESILGKLGLSDPQDLFKRPMELSGGMAQRACVATALGAPARLILVDEPTKGLDASRRREVAEALRLFVEEGRSVIVVTHDLALAAMLGGSTTVVREGAIVERGNTDDVLAHPKQAYTKQLIEADPACWPELSFRSGASVASLSNVSVRAGSDGPIIAERLDLQVGSGEIVGLVGPSGSGKTTIGDTILKLKPPVTGDVVWSSSRRKAYQKIYQNSGAAFAPWRTLGASVSDAVEQKRSGWSANRHNVDALMSSVGLATTILDRKPHQVSGGEMQRISLVRCLLCEPVFIFADEPTSRLDALTQKAVMQMLANAVIEFRIGMLLVSHDQELVRRMTSRSVDLQEGQRNSCRIGAFARCESVV
ncbi:MAG: ATP-binding cassette domain-containing protein [Beijerinckiaceae bacterium]|nr:ATP-binding cassette domain-containing protein [Beijerinckiaceae bacterium]